MNKEWRASVDFNKFSKTKTTVSAKNNLTNQNASLKLLRSRKQLKQNAHIAGFIFPIESRFSTFHALVGANQFALNKIVRLE